MVLVLISIRGDRDVNEVKLTNELTKLAPQYQAKTIMALTVPDAKAQKKWATQDLPLGYIAPDLADSFLQGSKTVAAKFPAVSGSHCGQCPKLCHGSK
jgi:prolyl-tRNA synthetase